MRLDESFGRETHQRLSGDEGANLVEYAMLMALIVVVCLSAMQAFGRNAASKMSCASSAVSQAGQTLAQQSC
jgi:pilus assembly protein Flp/PilA